MNDIEYLNYLQNLQENFCIAFKPSNKKKIKKSLYPISFPSTEKFIIY